VPSPVPEVLCVKYTTEAPTCWMIGDIYALPAMAIPTFTTMPQYALFQKHPIDSVDTLLTWIA